MLKVGVFEMLKTILAVTSIVVAMSQQAIAQDSSLTITVTKSETSEGVINRTSVSETRPARPGEFASKTANVLAFKGEIADAGEDGSRTIDLILCEPGVEPCRAIAKPKMVVSGSEPAYWMVGSDRLSYTVKIENAAQ